MDARFKDLCIDAADPALLGGFWSRVLARELRTDGEYRLAGPTPAHTVWFCPVPEPKAVKHRVHLDVYARSIADLEALGAHVVEPQGDRRWTVLADPEGGEFCAFLRDELPAERLHGLVVDCADPRTISQWWAGVLGGELSHVDYGSTIRNARGMPIETFDFVPVPEAKSAKNRVHWDVVGRTDDVLAAGATLVRVRDSDIAWDVLADPEGNEFCVFADTV